MTEITSNDLMVFLQGFKSSMELKIEETKDTLETKIDKKLNIIGVELNKLNDKIDNNEDVSNAINVRMNARLEVLEK